jgi:hypothetical protein
LELTARVVKVTIWGYALIGSDRYQKGKTQWKRSVVIRDSLKAENYHLRGAWSGVMETHLLGQPMITEPRKLQTRVRPWTFCNFLRHQWQRALK